MTVNSETIFELEKAAYSYAARFPALSGVDLAIHKGEKIALIGANGTGKSTLLQLLDGLIFCEKGTVKAFGSIMSEKVFSEEAFSIMFRRKVGFLFQDPDMQLFCPTVREDIIFGPLHLGYGKDDITRRLDRVTALLGIGELLGRSPHQLSVGEKRKAALASTLAIAPEVLILDEPTAGLDPTTVRQIVDILFDEHQRGTTLITATHDLHIVEEIADTVYVIGRERRIVRRGTPEEVLHDDVLLKEQNLAHIHGHRHAGAEHAHQHLHVEHHGDHEH